MPSFHERQSRIERSRLKHVLSTGTTTRHQYSETIYRTGKDERRYESSESCPPDPPSLLSQIPHIHRPSCIADQLLARECHTTTLCPVDPPALGVVSPSSAGTAVSLALACKLSHSQAFISSSVAFFFPFGGRPLIVPPCNPLFCNLSTRNISGNIKAAASPACGINGGGGPRPFGSFGGGSGGRGDSVDMQRPMSNSENRTGGSEMVVSVVHAQLVTVVSGSADGQQDPRDAFPSTVCFFCSAAPSCGSGLCWIWWRRGLERRRI
ncbi:hypothetical protein PENSPDRAFT_216124 [Peniophora sp. CONT]|nr:hypothetical protein PENSPDRAFT_216124 [Peniophora sp. CONT]